MRPHLLEFTAIGSYAGEVEIDFDALAPQGLFHIHGPTGAGKSSLIDAMCFALYGTIPGPRRADGLRSHHADPKVEAVARLTFSAQGQTWRIVRTPAQWRAKLRGEGRTEQRPTVSLYRKEGGGWATVSTGAKEVDPIVQRLLGLDAEQFMQVVVLPQGGFQKVLRAGADEREELLRHLFGSERFRNYTQHLKQRAESLGHKVNALTRSHSATAQRISTELVRFDIQVDGFPDHLDEKTLAALTVAKDEVASVAQKRAESAEAATKAAQRAEVVLRRRSIEYTRWQSKVGAEAKLTSLDQEAEEIEAIRAELEYAERAAPLAPLQQSLEASQQSFTASSSTRQVAQSAIAAIVQAHFQDEPEISTVLTDLVNAVPPMSALDSARRQIRDRLNQVHVAADLARQTLDERADIDHYVEEESKYSQQLEEVTRIVTDLVSQCDASEEELEKLKTDGAQSPQLEEQLRVLQNKLEAESALRNEQRRTQEIQKRLTEISSEQNDASQLLLDLLQRRTQSMAGELASKLIDGDPCAVCGSTVHPAPTPWVDVVGSEEIQAAQTSMQSLKTASDEIQKQLNEAQNREAAYRAAAGDVLDNRATAFSTREQLQLQFDLATRSKQEAQKLEALLGRAKEALQTQQAKETATRQQLVAITTRLEEARTRLTQLEDRLREQGGLGCIELSASLEAAHESVDVLASSIEEERRCAEALDTARIRLHELAQERDIDDIKDALAYLRNNEQLTMLRGRVKRWDETRAAAQATLEDPVVAGIENEPNIAEAEAALTRARTEHEEAVKLAASSSSHADQLIATINDLLAQVGEFHELISEYERVQTLFEICHGGRANTKKQSLERYILASYVEEVAEAASKRLHFMTSGRYGLRHSDARLRGNAASGLALLVTDAYTGQEREVNTLSGGETFLASLALALGLSDVVQAKAGGIHIEALFIDEGFGSLDPDSLELALGELDRLREGGRLVGVISHVATLRERIPAGIEVIAGPNGSTIRQINGFAAAL